MASLSGHSLGRYHILEQLGEGGMATVYKAYDTRLETDVAVKVIRTENLAPSILAKALKRFEQEAKSLAKLTHANIVKVLDYGEYEGKPYLVMPYLPGGTLKAKLNGRPVPWQEAARILLPITRALGYAHEQGMIHRDVKPANILITHSGDPMLTDFGIAKIIDEEATQDLTGTSAAMGTPEYMAPEQVTAKSVDHRADIYALGVVFYEMVTGRKPFQADTPMAVLFKHASEPLPRPTQFAPELPDAVEKILLKALAKKAENRYASMGELAAALEKLTQGAPTPVGLSTRPQRKEHASPYDQPNRDETPAPTYTPQLSPVLRRFPARWWGLGGLAILGVLSLTAILFVSFEEIRIRNWISPSFHTATVSEQAIPSMSNTEQATPSMSNTEQAIPSMSNTEQVTETLLQDEFDDPIYEGTYDLKKWNCADSECNPDHVNQQKGSLRLASSNSQGGLGSYLETVNFWKVSQVASIQSDLMVSSFSGDGTAEVILQGNIESGDFHWYTSCNLGGDGNSVYYVCKARTNGIDDYITRFSVATKGKWHLARIEFDQKKSEIRYYLDEVLIGSTSLPSAAQSGDMDMRVSIGAYSGGKNSLVGFIDNVSVTASK